jgi:ketosteroid isomerase-like protein
MKKVSVLLVIAMAVASGAWLLSGAAFSQAAGTANCAESRASSPADDLQQQVIAAERAGLDALKKGDVASFGDSTADEAVFVDDHGPASKAQVVKNVAGFTITDYAMEDIHFVPIDAGTGLVAYKLTEKGNSHGHEFTAQVYVSSVWTKRGGKWLCLFSQETAVRKPPAPTTTSNP